ncbi:hypothetical protein NLJ89_g6129 [Agrocybe chaxingu]|uniref:Uncharacterized protein n=1 Tax=Agrocybe chaxingu TaxID=84603 RepID=A0A9W8MUC9_9AGAR|nr:hypothetical protein NLJ89_g6129 [Agrocybe chaxingu]
MATYGRNRQSIADIDEELNKIFKEHPKCSTNESNEPVIPADCLVEVMKSLSDVYDGTPLMTDEEIAMLQNLIAANPGLEVTPAILLQFIAEKTKAATPPHTPLHDESEGYGHTRTDSNESMEFYRKPPSRPPSRGPTTPGPSIKSPLDSERRQRSTPLAAPSSWAKRPTPAGRRKSDAGSRSDNENGTPSAWGRTSGRHRAPSNPTSPSSSSRDLTFEPDSPDFGRSMSRPASRNRPRSQNGFNSSFDLGYSSPDDNYTVKRPMSRYGHNYNNSFDNAVSSLPMPRGPGGSDSDEEDDLAAALVPDRQMAASLVSMEDHERMEALQRNNEELGRKLMDAERTLQNKLEEHEVELEETHARLEELRSELSASNREEKELRAKDSRNMAQIAALEAAVAKAQHSLEISKSTYSSLQKQYQEQCAISEKYRHDLRQRDETIRGYQESASLQELETRKFTKEQEIYEERIAALEAELNIAMQAHTQLDEQKQENLLLKETIDRLRFEMDEMRSAATINIPGGGASGGSSAMNTISKSLGAELAGKMKWMAEQPEDEEVANEASTAVEVEEESTAGEDQDEEDVIQTIITRKRKVASRAKEILSKSTRREFEEMKEYSDSATQYDPTLFNVNHGVQTEPERKPVKTSFSIQTDPHPQPKVLPPPPPRITVDMDIQTDPQEETTSGQPSRSPSPGHDESMASSSSTIVPPTPKASKSRLLDPLDEPPDYHQITEADHEEREWVAASPRTPSRTGRR